MININLKLFSNYDLDYFFIENFNNKQEGIDDIIASINYKVFNQKDCTLSNLLSHVYHELFENNNVKDVDSEEEDIFNIGLTDDNMNSLRKQDWQKKDMELRTNFKFDNTFNIPKNLIYTSDIIFNIVSNELIKFMGSNKNMEVIINDNNIYNFNVRYKFPENKTLNQQLQEINKRFGYDFIEIEFNINMVLYPFYPVEVNLLRPKINTSLVYSLMDIEFLKFENWNPTNTLQFVIETMHKVFDQHANIIVDSELNSKSKAYIPLEYKLMQLGTKYKISSQNHEDLNVEFVKINKANNGGKSVDNKILVLYKFKKY